MALTDSTIPEPGSGIDEYTEVLMVPASPLPDIHLLSLASGGGSPTPGSQFTEQDMGSQFTEPGIELLPKPVPGPAPEHSAIQQPQTFPVHSTPATSSVTPPVTKLERQLQRQRQRQLQRQLQSQQQPQRELQRERQLQRQLERQLRRKEPRPHAPTMATDIPVITLFYLRHDDNGRDPARLFGKGIINIDPKITYEGIIDVLETLVADRETDVSSSVIALSPSPRSPPF